MRFETRKTCVSTGITSFCHNTAPSTLAVLRPTPGRRCICCRSLGTSPPNSEQSMRAMPARLRALLFEQRRGGHVDPFVGALRRKDHRHQQLVGVGVVQFALGHGHMLREPCDYAVVTLFGRHKCCFLRRKRIFFTRKIAPSGQKTSRGVRRRSAHQRARYSPTPAPFHESSQSPTT